MRRIFEQDEIYTMGNNTCFYNIIFSASTILIHLTNINYYDKDCAAVFKYLECYATMYRDDTTFICVDDKCNVDVFGEPDQAVQTCVHWEISNCTNNSCCTWPHDFRVPEGRHSCWSVICLNLSIGEMYLCHIEEPFFERNTPFRYLSETEKIWYKHDLNLSLLFTRKEAQNIA